MGAAEKFQDNRLFLEELMKQAGLLRIIAGKLKDTIASYTNVSVETGKPVLLETSKKNDVAVAGVIRFEGKDISIELFLGLSRDLFLFLYENMFQMPTDEINTENQDLAGEILNISFGAMDPEFKKLGVSMRSSFPLIYSGEKLEMMMANISSKAISIPYVCDGKTFTVNIYAANSLKESWSFS